MDGDRRRRRMLAAMGHGPIFDSEDDLRGFDVFAATIAELIDDPAVGRTVIAVNGPSGSGKSSLGHLIETKLKALVSGDRPVVWFDAWMHDEADNLSSAFIARLLLAADDHRLPIVCWFRPLPLRLIPPGDRIKKWIPLVLFLAALVGALTGAVGVPTSELLGITLGPVVGGLGALAVTARFLFTTADSVAAFVRNPGRMAESGALERVRKQLASVIAQATRGGPPLVIVIDDLDRVRGSASGDILEAIDQLIPGPVAVVVLAEVDTLVRAAEAKYGSPDKDSGRRYVERMIPVQFDLPWRNPAWSTALLNARIEHYPGAREAVGSYLEDALLPARRIKRVLSRLQLSLRIAEARGLFAEGSPIGPPHVGKWVVLQERWPGVAARLIAEPGKLAAVEARR
ncbi:MAG: AAA family ATPase [Proteobacteria bacterium]|nr:AAA family ATPase [Pseudomonadota bacterium]